MVMSFIVGRILLKAVIALVLYFFAALSAFDWARDAENRMKFLKWLLKHRLTIACVSLVIVFMIYQGIIAWLIWGVEDAPRLGYQLQDYWVFPVSVLIHMWAVISGIRVSFAYYQEVQQEGITQAEGSRATNKRTLMERWPRFQSWIEKQKHVWHWVALTSLLPIILSFTMVVDNKLWYFRPFDASSDKSYISSVEWVSTDEIEFTLVNFYLTDCMGCGYSYTVYQATLSTSKVEPIKHENVSQGFPDFPAVKQPIVSPDGTQFAYVVDRYDLYIKLVNGGVLSGRRVYRYENLNIIERHLNLIVDTLLISLVLAPISLLPWVIKHQYLPGLRRTYTIGVIWSVVVSVMTLLPMLTYYIWP